jgi:hypothetical protein
MAAARGSLGEGGLGTVYRLQTCIRIGLGLGVLAGAGLFGSGCATTPTTTIREHPGLTEAVAKLEKIAILPLEIGDLRHTALGGDELMPERERAIARELTRNLKTALTAKFYTVLAEPEAWPGDEIKPESPETGQLRSACASIINKLYDHTETPEEAAQSQVSVGPVAMAVATQRQADALLVARYSGYEKSGGRIAEEVVLSALVAGLTGVQGGHITGAEGAIELVLIDGASGELLWANRLSGRTDRKRGAIASRGYYGPADMAAKAIAPLPARVVNP